MSYTIDVLLQRMTKKLKKRDEKCFLVDALDCQLHKWLDIATAATTTTTTATTTSGQAEEEELLDVLRPLLLLLLLWLLWFPPKIAS